MLQTISTKPTLLKDLSLAIGVPKVFFQEILPHGTYEDNQFDKGYLTT